MAPWRKSWYGVVAGACHLTTGKEKLLAGVGGTRSANCVVTACCRGVEGVH